MKSREKPDKKQDQLKIVPPKLKVLASWRSYKTGLYTGFKGKGCNESQVIREISGCVVGTD